MKNLILAIIISQFFSACSVKECKTLSSTECTECKNNVSTVAPELTDKQILDAMAEAATPGEEHAALKPLAGEFTTTSKFWYDSRTPPEVVKGMARHYWILGNRFIREDFKSSWQNKPYSGIGHIGYDKTKNKYFTIWMDTSSTGIMTSEGSYDKANKTFNFGTKYICPVEGVEKTGRTATRIVDKNTNVFEMYDIRKDGSEFKMMEITYTRKK